MRKLSRLLIISHVVHYRCRGQLYSYAPYAREIDIWADLFPEVVIAAPCYDEAPPSFCAPFTRSNITIRPQKESGGESLSAKFKQITMLPSLVWTICQAMRQADAIHVRCPGNLGLLGT